MQKSLEPRICLLCPREPSISETFIRAHIERLPCTVVPVWGWRPSVAGRGLLSPFELFGYKAWRWATGEGLERQTTAAYVRAFTRNRAQAVLAEYGDHAVHAVDACRQTGLPLIVHFHGYDASMFDVLRANEVAYRNMFAAAAAIVVVSRAMERRLISLGAAPEKLVLNPYGVDCHQFAGATPATMPPVFVAVGRFTEKKAPHLTLLAFAQALSQCPDARLRMIGTGPLFDACIDLVRALRIEHAVTLLGAQGPDVVSHELRGARAFVQHSVEAASGDSEGTPVAIVEAGATGLPVISTRHGGIPDVVLEGRTGLLGDERDIMAMAANMVALAQDADRAGLMGAAARDHVVANFTMQHRLERLAAIIAGARGPAGDAGSRLSAVPAPSVRV